MKTIGTFALGVLFALALSAVSQEPLPPGCGPLDIFGYRVITVATTAEIENTIKLMDATGWSLVGAVDAEYGPFPGPDGKAQESYTATFRRLKEDQGQ